MTCPICGGEAVVAHTSDNVDHVIRYRKCVDCGVSFRTIETDDIPPVSKKGSFDNAESE